MDKCIPANISAIAGTGRKTGFHPSANFARRLRAGSRWWLGQQYLVPWVPGPYQLTINYQVAASPNFPSPIIKMKPNEKQFWRVANATIQDFTPLQVWFNGIPQKLQLIALCKSTAIWVSQPSFGSVLFSKLLAFFDQCLAVNPLVAIACVAVLHARSFTRLRRVQDDVSLIKVIKTLEVGIRRAGVCGYNFCYA
jgi:hypothetical protein